MDPAQKKRIIDNLKAERDKLQSNSVYSDIGLGPENPSPRPTKTKVTDPTSIDCQSDVMSNNYHEMTQTKYRMQETGISNPGHTTFVDQNFPTPFTQDQIHSSNNDIETNY